MATNLDTVEHFSFGAITKAHRNSDGTVAFEASKATGPDLDGDQQILDAEWAKSAMADWFKTGANIRESHQAIAAGKALTLESRADGEYVSGVVVDPVSAKKVDLGVLSGLSVGIKAPQIVKDASAPNGRVVGGRIVEISLVDRPCNSTCKIVMAKADGSGAMQTVEELVEAPQEATVTDAEKTETEPALSKADVAQMIADAIAGIPTPAAPVVTEPEPVVKTETATETAPEMLTKADLTTIKTEFTDGLSDALTKALEPLNERLAKVEAMPAGGGPVITATVTAAADDKTARKRALLAKAEAATDPNLAAGYRQMADEIV